MEKNIREFAEYVKGHLPDYLSVSEEYQIQIQEVLKENDTKLTAICISESNKPCCTMIYLEGFMDSYMSYYKPQDIEEVFQSEAAHRIICRNIAEAYKLKRTQQKNISYGELKKVMESFACAKNYLRVGICDPEKNAEGLKKQVYDICGDFAQYYYLTDVAIPDTLIRVTDNMLQSWGISKDDVRTAALDNMKQEMMLIPLARFANEMGMETEQMAEVPDVRILTNGKMTYGAAMIMNLDVQKKVAQTMKGDYYVLPSSVHEVLIYPGKDDMDLEYLSEMVKGVNQTAVSDTDFLSDKIQHYSAYAHILENAYTYQENLKENPEKYGKEKREKTRDVSVQALIPAF